MKRQSCFQVLLFSLAFSFIAQAQILKGRVVDLSGQGIPDVKVAVGLTCTPPPGLPVPIGTPVPYTLGNSTQTNSDGSFEVTFPFPIPGGSSCGTRSYAWGAYKPGFTFSSVVPILHSPPAEPVLIRGTDLPAWAHVSAASYASNTLLASESIAAAFGVQLATTIASATTLPLPTELAGRSVRITDSANEEYLAPLLFVSPGQINYLLPTGLAEGIATVTLLAEGRNLRAGFIQIARVAPALFTANANGSGVPTAVVVRVRPGEIPVYESVAQFDQTEGRFVPLPLDLGSESEFLVLALFGTGWRQATVNEVRVQVRKDNFAIDLPLEYVGPQPTLAGLDQINARLPRALIGKGECIVSVISGSVSNPVLLNFK
jgi:uncharacterized protein (TIGR03437 family)